MASRPELVAICKELKLNCRGISIAEMDKMIRTAIDKKFGNKKVWFSTKECSDTLIKFMTQEYHYIIKTKEEFDKK